jgi:hypothetical protein
MSYHSVRVVRYLVPYTRTQWQAVVEWRVQVQKRLYISNIDTCECCALAELGFLVRRWLLHVNYLPVSDAMHMSSKRDHLKNALEQLNLEMGLFDIARDLKWCWGQG